MNTKAQRKNRHGEIAEDSRRVCVIVPASEYENIVSMLDNQHMTVSSVVREFITLGRYNRKLKDERAKGRLETGIDKN